MSELGRLTPSSSGDLSYFSGYIHALDGRIPVAIEGDEALCDQQRPSHRVTTRARDNSTVEIGAAWLKTARHGPQKGKRFLSIQIDHPERQSALNVAAFPNEKTLDWIVVWRRRGLQASTTAA